MQQTNCPITFCDAAKFSRLEAKASRNGPDSRAAFRLRKFSLKLVEKSVPEIISRNTESYHLPPSTIRKYMFANGGYPRIANIICSRELAGEAGFLYSRLDGLNEYKNSPEAKFSLKGQTLASIWKHFGDNAHAIYSHQGTVAGGIFEAISINLVKILPPKKPSNHL